MAKNENLYTTGRAVVAGFVAIQKPSQNYQKTAEEYQIKVAIEGDVRAKFEADMAALRDAYVEATIKETPKEKVAALKKTMKLADIGTPELDENGEETGRLIVKFKQAAQVTFTKNGKEETIDKFVALFDARGNKVTKPVRIGPGSVVKVSFDPNPYFSAKDKEFGISFNRLSAVKLIKLEEYTGSGGSASDYGFGDDEEDIEDGFDVTDFSGGSDEKGGAGQDESDF